MPNVNVCVTLFHMDELRDSLRAWLRDVLDERQLTPNKLAGLAGFRPTTLTRFLNDSDAKHTLSTPTIDAIVRATGCAPPRLRGAVPVRPARREVDAAVLAESSGDERTDEAVRYLCQADPNLAPWQLHSRAIEALGYLPGDVVIVDQATEPATGDVVCAQVYEGRGAETKFRLYQRPWLLPAAIDRLPRVPILVDDRNARVAGVVVAMFRPRRSHLDAA